VWGDAVPSDQLVVGAHLAPLLDGLLARLDALFELALLKVDGCTVQRFNIRVPMRLSA